MSGEHKKTKLMVEKPRSGKRDGVEKTKRRVEDFLNKIFWIVNVILKSVFGVETTIGEMYSNVKKWVVGVYNESVFRTPQNKPYSKASSANKLKQLSSSIRKMKQEAKEKIKVKNEEVKDDEEDNDDSVKKDKIYETRRINNRMVWIQNSFGERAYSKFDNQSGHVIVVINGRNDDSTELNELEYGDDMPFLREAKVKDNIVNYFETTLNDEEIILASDIVCDQVDMRRIMMTIADTPIVCNRSLFNDACDINVENMVIVMKEKGKVRVLEVKGTTMMIKGGVFKGKGGMKIFAVVLRTCERLPMGCIMTSYDHSLEKMLKNSKLGLAILTRIVEDKDDKLYYVFSTINRKSFKFILANE